MASLRCEHVRFGLPCRKESKYIVSVPWPEDGEDREYSVCVDCLPLVESNFEGRVTIVAFRRSPGGWKNVPYGKGAV